MKFTAISAIALLALVPQAMAWRVFFYQHKNYNQDEAGGVYTWAGEGRPGTNCFGLGTLNNEISSMHFYYADAAGNNGCCLTLYDSPNCETKDDDWTPKVWCSDTNIPNFAGHVYQDDVSSFRTTC
ncbi:hypothetical protein B0O99DRAFT_746555 [Bisporella sp. PMI_857]|nr:hypothetical protein B0O99DRAFT_746555 [Bisporella sp. PMI_857]